MDYVVFDKPLCDIDEQDMPEPGNIIVYHDYLSRVDCGAWFVGVADNSEEHVDNIAIFFDREKAVEYARFLCAGGDD